MKQLHRKTPSEQDKDSLFVAISKHRRREALVYTYRQQTVGLRELVSAITQQRADRLEETEQSSISSETYASLYHVDIPKLAEVGLVEYDEDTERITITSRGEALGSWLENDPLSRALVW